MKEHNKTQVLLDKNKGQEYTSTVTNDVWLYDIDKQNNRNNFAEPIHNNSVKSYVQSYEYFQDLINAIENAKKEIYIAGWQVNWDAILAPNLRLVDLLLKVVQKEVKLKIFILLWKHQYPLDTYDNETQIVLRNYLNEKVNREAVAVRLHSNDNDEPCYSMVTKRFFSHHQKSVIIDRKIAFVGGIDLAYGRYSHGYKLDPNADKREVANRYNPCIVPMDVPKKEKTLSFDIKEIKSLKNNEKFQNEVFVEKCFQRLQCPKTKNILNTLADNQPIMPWQDIQIKIEGKAVFDLLLNFVLRWNQADNLYSEPKQMWVTDECIHRALPLPTKEELDNISDAGDVSVQILRGASKLMCKREANTAILNINSLSRSEALRYNMPSNVRNNINFKSRAQSDIYQAMINIIKKAKRYIYLENQFFTSDYGRPFSGLGRLSKAAKTQDGIKPIITRILSFNGKKLPKNQIVKELSNKIAHAIFAFKPEPFHIYITLPVHPEGKLNDGPTMATIHHTMQTISFGSDSLLNRIRKHLWVYQQLIKDEVPRKEWGKMRSAYYDKIGNDYQTIPLEECSKYVTLLNLRSWAQLKDRTETEQIYVHSKLTIVDDLYVIVGSANINDRSLLGGRDSELAALIVDNDTKIITCPERGINIPVRTFAYQLRKQIWQGLYGEGLEQAIEVPELASSVKAIQSRAKENAYIYESVFPFIPRNYIVTKQETKNSIKIEYMKFASIWPVLDDEKLSDFINGQCQCQNPNETIDDKYTEKYFKNNLEMPFNHFFWENYNINQPTELQKIKGHITLLPIHWTEGENNAVPYHIRLVT